MAWLRFDDNYPQHPKVIGLSTYAAWLNTTAICYAGRHHTDGYVPKGAVPKLWAFEEGVRVPDLVAELLAVRLWEERPGGYLVHDFLDYNPSRDDVASAQEARRMGGQARAAQAGRVSGRFTKKPPAGSQLAAGPADQLVAGEAAGGMLVPAGPATPPGEGVGSSAGEFSKEVQTEHERKGGSDSGLSLLPAESSEPPAFSSFWARYPRKRGKQDALAVWKKLRVGVALAERIFAAVERDCVSPEWVRDGGRFIPEPAKWLRGKRWEDEGTALPTVSEATAHNAQVARRWLDRKREG